MMIIIISSNFLCDADTKRLEGLNQGQHGWNALHPVLQLYTFIFIIVIIIIIVISSIIIIIIMECLAWETCSAFKLAVNCVVSWQNVDRNSLRPCNSVFAHTNTITLLNWNRNKYMNIKKLSIAWLSNKTVLGALSGLARVFWSVYINRNSHDSECTRAKSIEFEPKKSFQSDSSQRVSIRNR